MDNPCVLLPGAVDKQHQKQVGHTAAQEETAGVRAARGGATDGSDDDCETDEDVASEPPRRDDPLVFLSSVKNAIDVVFELFSDQKDVSEWF